MIAACVLCRAMGPPVVYAKTTSRKDIDKVADRRGWQAATMHPACDTAAAGTTAATAVNVTLTVMKMSMSPGGWLRWICSACFTAAST
jgi:hypothetical protein